MWPWSDWKPDPITSALTLVVAPIAIYAALALRKFVTSATRYVVDGLIYGLNKAVIHAAAASLTLKGTPGYSLQVPVNLSAFQRQSK